MRKPFYLLVLQILLFFPLASSAQEVLFAEDFASGFPTDWITYDLNNTSAKWKYCPMHSQQIASCPKVYGDNLNEQTVFNSTTAANGFMHLNSDALGDGIIHNSALESSAFDFSTAGEVWLKFEMHLGVFNFPSLGNAVVEVSSDGQTWQSYNTIDIVPGQQAVPGQVRWSKNPALIVIDISTIAANQEEVFIRWRWSGQFEFYFAIDDIILYDEDPSALFLPQQDLEMTQFYAIPPNYSTPKSQTEPFAFFGDFRNNGIGTIDSVQFTGLISDNTGSNIFLDSVFFESIGPDTLVQNIPFPNTSTPISDVGVYFGEYAVNANFSDPSILNNKKTFAFNVTDSIFAKTPTIVGHTRPVDAVWGNSPHDWAWGNHYFVPNGAGEFASGISFSVAPPGPEPLSAIAGTQLQLFLYKWENTNDDNEVQVDERELLGFANYTIDGTESTLSYIYVPFAEEVPLEDQTGYIAMVSFLAQATTPDINMGIYTDLDYTGMILQTELSGQRRYASILYIPTLGNTSFSTEGFGYSFVPNIRLHLRKTTVATAAHEILSPLIIYPNPVDQMVSIQLPEEMTFSRAVNYRIRTVQGKIIRSGRLSCDGICQLDCRNFTTGSYFLELWNDEKRTIGKLLVAPRMR